ncbi:N-acetyl sugar amidotransferase [Alsobacter sp. R-9]
MPDIGSTSLRYRICTRCVMDSSDPLITFDEAGVCNHCHNLDDVKRRGQWMTGEEGARHIRQWVDRIKRVQAGQRYDCIIGLSGGVDSSYLAVKAKELGLRCLAVHVDAGWNSEIAVGNIERLLRTLDMDLVTKVVDWDEMRDLQVAFLKAGVPNQDIPQDHSFFSFLYGEARKWKINFQLQGRNYASESVLPKAWGYSAMDGVHLRAIHARFGTRPLKHYRVMSTAEYVDYFAGIPTRPRIEIVDLLNFMEYDPKQARVVLAENFGWRDYGEKHWESHWTKFFQSYYLPRRFGFDKRRAHLASLVLAGAVSRDQALRELQKPPFDEERIDRDIEFVRRKLRLSTVEWDAIMNGPTHPHTDYPTGERRIARSMKMAMLVREMTPATVARVVRKRLDRLKRPARTAS